MWQDMYGANSIGLMDSGEVSTMAHDGPPHNWQNPHQYG